MPGNIYENSIYLNLHSFVDLSNQIFLKNLIKVIYSILINTRIIFLGLAIWRTIKILIDKSVIFSLWNSQGRREPSENDLDDIYIEIAKKITEDLKENEKKIIIIDDLDRANSKQEIQDFVKEIGLNLNKWGNIEIDEEYKTSNPKIYSGGDLAGVKGTVAWAANSGREAAKNIRKACINEIKDFDAHM